MQPIITSMKKISFFIFLVTLVQNLFSLDNPKEKLFEFKHQSGDKCRIISTVNEKVYFNNKYMHTAEILNRISTNVKNVDSQGTGTIEATFMTTENSTNSITGNTFSWGQEYKSIFNRTTTGTYEIEDIYFMPVVRNVPTFPNYKIRPGDKWLSEGHEAHDLRRTFEIPTPFKVPFTAIYEYKGDKYDENAKKTLSVFEVTYNLYFESPVNSIPIEKRLNAPAITTGNSKQIIWWDYEKGIIHHYTEEFRIVIETFYGDTLKFQGTSHAKVTEFEHTNTEENIQKISDSISQMGIENVEITKGEKGLTISIENIQFMPDSSELMPSEKEKLTKISEILKNFPNDLLITGHCALRGTKENQQRISEERAVSVAKYLQELKIRDSNCIFTQGKGATVPVDSNSTEKGRARNRRVEITLMDE